MTNSKSKIAVVWTNFKYFVYTLLTLAIVIPILIGLWWMIQAVVVALLGTAVFIVYKILGTKVPNQSD